MKNSILFIIFLFSANSLASSLTDIVNKGLEYSLENKISDEEKSASEYKLEQSLASYWPSVELSAKSRTINRGEADNYIRDEDENTMLNFSVRYTLLDVARDSQSESARLSVAGRELNSIIQKEKNTFNIIKAYFNVWQKEQDKRNIKSYLDSTTVLTQKVKARVNGGLSQESDYIRAKVALDEARARYENIEKELKEGIIRLNALVGEDISITEKHNKPLSVPEFIKENEVITISPLLKMLKTEVDVKKYEYKAALRENLPKLQLVGSYKEHFKKTTSPDMQVYLQVTMPLFDGGVIRNRANELSSQMKISEYKMQTALRELNRNYSEVKSNLEREVKLQKIYNETRSNSQKNITLYESEFMLGTRPLSDLISAHRELLTASLSMTSSRMNYYVNLAAMYNLYGDTKESIKFM